MRIHTHRHLRYSAASLVLLTGSSCIAGLACGTNFGANAPPAARTAITEIDPTVFHSDFLWGAGLSSHQADGDDIHSDWWHFETAGRTASGETSGLACDHWNRYEEDFDLLLALGLDTFRFSLSWSRLFPREDMTEPDPDAVAHYDARFEALAARRITPIVTLHHFAMPQWLTAQSRWEDGRAVADFARLTQFAAARWGRYVDWWLTINELEIYVLQGWVTGRFPPGKNDLFAARDALANLLGAHIEAYRLIHEWDTIDADGDGSPARVGFTQSVMPFHPRAPLDMLESITADFLFDLNSTLWLRALRPYAPETLALGPAFVANAQRFAGTFDFVGLNYYGRKVVRFDLFSGLHIGSQPGAQVSTLDMEVYPQGMYDALELLSGFGVPLMVVENGIADGDDAMRSQYIIDHVAQMARFMRDRPETPVLGYVHWSLIDNFEWENGFSHRFGLYAIDYTTQERTRRPSAATYRDLVQRLSK